MANRFVRKIKSGEIESVDALKSEFKALAKLSHPDLLGPGTSGDEFARLRHEYETALRDFGRHRFDARSSESAASTSAAGRGGDPSGAVWSCLALLLKRGFPKLPHHEKEALRYEYARWRLELALGPELGERLRACEAELLDSRAAGSKIVAPFLDLLRLLIDYRTSGMAAMRTEIVLSLGALRADPRFGGGAAIFARELAALAGISGEIGPRPVPRT
jgi:hypothetical protein